MVQSLSLCSESYFRYQSLEELEHFKGNSSLIPIHHHRIMSCCSYWHILSNPIPQYDCITNKARKATTKFKDRTEDEQGKKIPITKQTKKGHILSGNTNFYFALNVASFNKEKKEKKREREKVKIERGWVARKLRPGKYNLTAVGSLSDD